MKLRLIIVVFIFFFVSFFQIESAKMQSVKKELTFEGTVLQIGPSVFQSGRASSYQLVKYRIERICKGNYKHQEIVVDHLILSGKELDGIKVGDKLFVTVRKAKKINPRYNVPGLREPSESISNFYIGGTVSKNDPC